MAELTLDTLDLATLTPPELEQRRRTIVESLLRDHKGYDDPSIPEETLHMLAVITKTLRQKSSGPPKTAKNRSSASTKTISSDDLLG